MKKDSIQNIPSSSSCVSSLHSFSAILKPSISKKPAKARKISELTKKGIRRAFKMYLSTGCYSESELENFRFHLVQAAERRKYQLESELDNNGVEICPTLESSPNQNDFDMMFTRTALATQVAHGRTFGKPITKCPSCSSGTLYFEIKHARYVCAPQLFIASSLAPNCGLVYENIEIQHLPWNSHSS